MDNKTKFINLMENDIFGLDRELDFGIYHLFKVSKKQIEKILKNIAEDADDDIYDYLYNFFSLYYEGGDFGYTKRAFATFTIPYIHKEYQTDLKEKCSFESSHSFFYDGEETKFTWKTEDSYYIKSSKYFNKLIAKIGDYEIIFKVVGEDENFDSKKTRLFRFINAKKDDNKIILNFNISNTQTPKHVIYLVVRNMIKKGLEEFEYVKSEDFEKIPSQNSLFSNFEIENYKKYLFKDSKSIFENKKSGEEDKVQIFSFPKLYITKKDYIEKVYNKNELKNLLNKKTVDLDKDIDRIFEEDENLEFFYKLDRVFNDFITGVDSDYFIHKNLKRFLLTELDKFIKNYVLYDTEKLLSKEGEDLRKKALKFKQKAEELIDFLAAVEEFQKYIWEKRKLIKKVHYIISSNKLKNDEDLLKEILKNKNQTDEWKNLGLCDKSPNIDDLKQKPYPVDTKHFDEEFKIRLLSGFSDLDSETDGILIKSENFQALKFLEPKFKEQIKCIYIDPPYNTGNDGFVYKDKYKKSSWLSMMNDRLRLAKDLMRDDGVIFSSIDDNELDNLSIIFNHIFSKEKFIAKLPRTVGTVPKTTTIIQNRHDYVICYVKKKMNVFGIDDNISQEHFKFNDNDGRGEYALIHPLDSGTIRYSSSLDYKIYFNGKYFIPGGHLKDKPANTWSWRWNKDLVKWAIKENLIVEKNNRLYTKNYKSMKIEKNGNSYKLVKKEIGKPYTSDILFSENFGNRVATREINSLFNENVFKNPKPTKLIETLISMIKDTNLILDFFAGSGTTGDAVIRLNKEDERKRKFILIEVNDYFETVIIPRIKKVSFSTEWKNGKAQKSNGIGGIYQYIYLQQYDEFIENLKIELKESDIEAEYLFNPLKNNINEIEIKPTLEILFSFIYHKGFKLKEVKKEENFLIGICEEGVVVLGEGKTDFKQFLDKYTSKVYTNLKPENNINPDKNEIEIITSADFKGI
ncbi:site-specific DNA-methyltransferase [Caminibacter sp.]